MTSVDEAIQTILYHTQAMETERLPILETLNRVLAADVVSQRDHPPWNNSAMDGYAVQWDDIRNATPEAPAILNVMDEVQAGGMSTRAIGRGEAIQIMTGAPVPGGADSVVRVEDTAQDGDTVKIFQPCKKGRNIRLKGEDIQQGQCVIPANTFIRPAEVGMLATAGQAAALIYQQPKVTVLATGNELAEPGEMLRPEKIVNSNSYSIAALTRESGATPVLLETAKDTKTDLETKVRQALSADIGIVIGGVSMGKYDFVRDVLKDVGCEMKFWRVNIRPGHPVAFGVLSQESGRTKLLFGLPGNPVSCIVAFYQFVRPAIRRMMGLNDIFLPRVAAVLEEDTFNRSSRRHFSRAITTYRDGDYHVRLSGAQGSGILTSMVQANSFLVLPEDGGEFKTGERVQVQLLPGW